MKGARDWRTILHDTAADVTLASAIWASYEYLVKPLQETTNTNAGVYIQLKNNNGDISQIMLGADIHDKEIFVSCFAESVQKLAKLKTKNAIIEEQNETINSGCWLKVKWEPN